LTALRDELQRTLGDAFTLGRELGGGGMSTVFVATDNTLGREVVVKVLPYELAATVSVERFKREIMLSAALQHPHIVPVLSAGEITSDADDPAGSRLPFFIMPFVEGESLRSRLGRGPLSVREAVSILKDVARALVYAHGRGVIHRDIKPDNILISGGSATVTDFGVAKAILGARTPAVARSSGSFASPHPSVLTQVGASLGTPAYMAPEQAAGDPDTDHRADLYALGIVGYEMLVGTTPFHGRNPQQLLAAQLTEQPPPIATRRYDVPEALATLIGKLLEKDPNGRPRSASEVARALEDPAVVSGTFHAPTVPKPAKPRRVVWALAGAGILAAAGMYMGNHRAEETTRAVAPAAARPVTAVAVLPLANIGRDTSDSYLAEGMTAEISAALSRLPGVRVASQTAATSARGRAATPAELGKLLNVTMMFEGTVQRAGTKLRVTGRLVNIADDATLWSDVFEREVKDLFAVQDEISNAIAAAISPELTKSAADNVAVTDRGTRDLQAYDLYLRGRYFFQKRGGQALRRALEYFQQAASSDSSFARAYTGIADVYALLPLYTDLRADSVTPLALRAIDRAIALDSALPEAYASRGNLLQASWKWSEAERDYRRALALDAENSTAHQWYGELLLLNGRVDEARTQLKRAVDLDPLSPITLGSYALALGVARQYDAAIAAGRKGVELDSTLLVTRFMLGGVFLEAGRMPEGLVELEAAAQLDPSSVYTLGLLGYGYAKSGATSRAREVLAALEARMGRGGGATAAAARVHLGLGDLAGALSLLDRAAAEHDPFFSSESLAEAFFDPLRADPRFAAIARKVGLDQRVLAKR
jgi:serine/threonine-protein kinase